MVPMKLQSSYGVGRRIILMVYALLPNPRSQSVILDVGSILGLFADMYSRPIMVMGSV